jgi:hypothetical protein
MPDQVVRDQVEAVKIRVDWVYLDLRVVKAPQADQLTRRAVNSRVTLLSTSARSMTQLMANTHPFICPVLIRAITVVPCLARLEALLLIDLQLNSNPAEVQCITPRKKLQQQALLRDHRKFSVK